MSITGKVILSMFIVVSSIMLLIASYTYNKSEQLMLFQIERELSSEIANVEREVFSFFQRKGEIVRQLSIIPVIQNVVAANDRREVIRSNPNYDWLQHALTGAKKSNEDIEIVWLASLEHNYYVASDDHLSDYSFNIENRAWYPAAQLKDGPSYSPLYVDFTTGKFTISIVNPVTVENERLGYLGVDVHLDDLPKILSRFEKDGRRLVLVSEDGQVLYDEQDMWSTLEKESVGKEKVFQLSSAEEVYYADVRPVGDLGWQIAVYVPEDVVLELFSNYQMSLILFWIVALIILLIILWVVLKYLLSDIPFITNKLKKMEHGDFNIEIGIERQDEVGEIADAVNQMAQKIHMQMEELDYQANFDSLTKLPNRNSIERTLDEWILLAQESGQIIAVAFFDLDHFKQVNDSKGHAYGDELLVQVGKRINALLSAGSFFGRFGGDEFVLIQMAKQSEIQAIRDTLQLVHDAFGDDFELYDHTVHMTASMGVSLFPEDAQTKKELLAHADTALYKVKEVGRNLIYFFNAEMKENLESQLKLEEGLRTAIENNEFSLHYQPQLAIALGRTTSVEALIRWDHPEWGMISPADFIPLAESSGRICEIGDWVIDTSLRTVKQIVKEYPYIERIAINVSAIQLREQDFVQNLIGALDKHGVSPELLEIEITESVIIGHQEETIQRIKELKELGVQIALDDFGTGYSSLNYLRMMPIDRVKVDRSFVQRLDDDPIAIAILKAIVQLGHSLAFEIVAEGVENETQLELLREMNVDSIQGFYYSRPVDEVSLYHFLEMQKYPV